MSAPRQHVLLVGIDAYSKVQPLHGCVNDVDALETIFLDRLSVAPEGITKLVAPHVGAVRTSKVAEDPPTADKFRRALERLASDIVQPGDRVFIHYSGHGTQVLSRTTRTAREALVPVDAHAGGDLLFDYEINELLRRIAARTSDLTVILDCCCSAGATRSTLVRYGEGIRFCHMDGLSESDSSTRIRSADATAGLVASLDPSDPGFLVVASAQSGEAANEGRDARGVRHGAFTSALLDLLAGESTDNIQRLRWVDIWQNLRARLTSAYPGQHPCLIGRSERRVFGGPFQPRDAGLPIEESAGMYHIRAGTLVGLGEGAIVAVYGPEPSFFPRLHSPEDMSARRGLLRVERANPSSAVALPMGRAFHVDGSHRGRLVKPGKADKLVVGLDRFDPELAKYIESEVSAVVVPLAEHSGHELEAVVGSFPDGSWWVGDDIYGPEAPLVYVAKNHLPALARALEHHARFSLPIRLLRRCRDGVGALRLRVLDASCANNLAPDESHDPPLLEAERDPTARYDYRLTNGQPVCFRVENRSSKRLYTHLVNCAASGKVQILGPTQLELPPMGRQTIWLQGHLRKPFLCRVSKGRESNVERLIVIGTTSAEVDLTHLRVGESFADAISRTHRSTALVQEEPTASWTAAGVTVEVERVDLPASNKILAPASLFDLPSGPHVLRHGNRSFSHHARGHRHGDVIARDPSRAGRDHCLSSAARTRRATRSGG